MPLNTGADFKSDGSVAMTGPLQTNGVVLGASNALEQRNGTNAQSWALYNTYTNGSNYEAGVVRWVSNALEIATTNAGAGANRYLYLRKPQNTAGSWEYGDTWLRYVVAAGPSYGIRILGDNGSGHSSVDLGSGGAMRWGSNQYTHLGSYDTSLYRGAAGRVDVCTAAAGTFGDLKARNLIATGNIVANATSTTGIFEAYLNPANTYSTEKALFGPAITVANYGSGYAGLWLGGTVAQNAPSTSNYTLVGDGSTTILNVPNAGTLHFAVFGAIKATLNNSGNFGIGINATQRLEVAGNIQNSGYQRTTPVTVATLTAAATAGNGARHAVTDSTVAASGNFGAAVVGGGANNVPVVVSNGAWVIG